MEEDQELERKAIEELLKEAKRGKTRAETMGPMGWMKCPLAGTNKRFLINTIKNTLPSHKEQDQEPREGSKEPAESPASWEEASWGDGRRPARAHPYQHGPRASPPRARERSGRSERSERSERNSRSGRSSRSSRSGRSSRSSRSSREKSDRRPRQR